MSSPNIIGTLLFILQSYHVIGHLAVLLRIRLLPRKDLLRIQNYFFAETFTVFIISFIYTGTLRWLATLHILQHLYYFVTWDKSPMAKKIIDWSSLDWFSSYKKNRLELDSILGTAFDTGVHIINAVILSQYISYIEILIGLAVANASISFVMFSTRFAWSNPNSMPDWVHKRIKPIVPIE